jgi:hypothetical protein
LAIILPFVSVFLKTGCGVDLLINILLCCLGWIPGVIRKWKKRHPARYLDRKNDAEMRTDAWWVISKGDPATYR